MEVVEGDPRERRGENVNRDPNEPLPAPRKKPPGQEVDRPRTKGEGGGLKDDQRLRWRDDGLERDDEKKGRREVVEEEGVRIAALQTQRRLHEAAVNGIPEHLVEHAEIERRRVERPVPDERERAEHDDVHEGPSRARSALRVGRATALFSRSETLSFGGHSLISTAARDRVKLAIDQCEEQFHVYDDKSSLDTLDSYEAALNRGKAMGFQEAAHYVKSALHDIDVKSL